MKMNRTKQLQMISIFIAALVVCIPIYVSDAYAATLSVNKYSGRDNINGFLRRADELNIEVAASTGETEDIQPDNLRLFLDDSTAYTFFDNCTRVGTGFSFNCYLIRDYVGWSGIHMLKIDLHTAQTKYDEFASPASTETVQIAIDVAEAFVDNISLIPKRTKENRVNISFRAIDYGIEDGNQEGCSGIDRVEFYKDSYLGELVRTRFPAGDLCFFEDNFIYEAPGEDGEVLICAKAFDRLGQSRTETKCDSFFIDNQAPRPQTGSVSVVDSATKDHLYFVGGEAVSADISVLIPDEDLVVATVRADLSALAGPRFADVPISDSVFNDGVGYTLTWRNLPIDEPVACFISVTAADEIGNSDTKDMICDVKVDTTGPEVTSLQTGFTREGIYYLAVKSMLVATITEKGVGLSKGDMLLDLTNINQQSRVKPDNCTMVDNNIWACLWTIEPTVADGEYPVTMLKESKDDLTNIMEEKYTQTIGVDKTSPQVNQEVMMAVTPSVVDVPYEDILISGDNLEFVLEVDDVYSAFADFSSIGGGTNVSPAGCWQENESTFCKWEVQVQSSGPYDAELTFDFSDFTGNHNSITKNIFVSGLINSTNPDYWDHTVSCSPDPMDRELASMLEMHSFCHIDITPKSHANAEIMSFSMENYPADCEIVGGDDTTNTTTSLTDYVNDIIMLNNNPLSLDPYMNIVLNAVEYTMDDIEFQCAYEIFTRIENDYTLHPEIENVSVTLSFYNEPFGTLEDEYDNEVEDVADRLGWLDGWFDELMTFFDYAERACELYEVLNNIVGILTIFSTALGTAKTAYTPLEQAWATSCQGEDKYKDGIFKMGKIFDPLCAFINCKWSDDALTGAWGDYAGGSGVAEEDWMQSFTNLTFDVKESIIWSLATVCVPGILYNIRKWQEIECDYGYCLLTYIPAGYPMYVCTENYGYRMCQLVWGQIFNAVPWMQIWQNIMGKIQQNFADPISLIFWIVSMVTGCNVACKPGSPAPPRASCAIMGTLSMIGKAVEDVNQIKEQGFFDSVGNGSCARYSEAMDDYEE